MKYYIKANISRAILEALDQETLSVVDGVEAPSDSDMEMFKKMLGWYEEMHTNPRGVLSHPGSGDDREYFPVAYNRVKRRLDLLAERYGPKPMTWQRCGEKVDLELADNSTAAMDNYCVVTSGHNPTVVPHVAANGKQRFAS